MAITTQDIAQLRAQTGVGVMDAKKALTEAGGDSAKAVEVLRKHGEQLVVKKSDRATNEGLVDAYVHANGKIAAVVGVACETDFVARTDDFKKLVHDIALHIAASDPTYITVEEIPEDVLEKERDVYREQLVGEGKPADMIDKILDGKMEKFYEQTVLISQPFVKDDSKTVGDLIKDAVQSLGENIRVTSMVRVTL